MSDITLWSFVAVALVVLVTACTQAVVGFGFALLTVPICLLYTSPSPRDRQKSRMPSSA